MYEKDYQIALLQATMNDKLTDYLGAEKMNIDSYYSEIDKNNFYLGMISQVSRNNIVLQAENLSLLNNRKNKTRDFNT